MLFTRPVRRVQLCLEPKLIPDFVLQLWRKIGRTAWKDFARDVESTGRKGTSHTVRVMADSPRERDARSHPR